MWQTEYAVNAAVPRAWDDEFFRRTGTPGDRDDPLQATIVCGTASAMNPPPNTCDVGDSSA
jgi:hypothetical protein